MAVLDANGSPIEPGDVVQMIPTLSNHDVVKGVDYDVVTINYGALTINDPDGNTFTGRRASAFFKVQRSGPW